jgi:hypothetical protein
VDRTGDVCAFFVVAQLILPDICRDMAAARAKSVSDCVAYEPRTARNNVTCVARWGEWAGSSSRSKAALDFSCQAFD